MTVQLDDVTVHFGRTCALESCTLTVAAGETVALLGPSGSGKSTALKAVAGFVRPSSGRIRLDGQDVTELPPAKRGIGVVVQQYALFPHLRVEDNVAFGLRAARRPKGEVTRRVAEMLGLVGMTSYARRFPRELSGGQQQRVAIARALAIRPKVLLLDEPLAALDAQLRADLLIELQNLRREVPTLAIIYVTHDQSEALALADRIAVMRDARLIDLAPTTTLYQTPPSAFTASFLGNANLLPIKSSNNEVTVAGHVIPGVQPISGKELLCIRPHAVRLGAGGVPGRVTGVQWRGASYQLTCEVADVLVRVDLAADGAVPAVGADVQLVLPSEACSLVSR
ncbi:ABC transporter ATP-binding protein [Kribbella sandramycini]|uniref:ABC-type quaternary amine transporter n=1 Tax=Kribbella sandramycini TaxID=60450 RepID=A0A7Y4L4A8_9ACTN|nr:ABC transporter ATP-binding protein [Kribbella sandramycini]MBB6571418.1 2-aminoethylphosphonate transport system ATP-binding protein [Kribbella sandramycini]NOL43182.1 ABC transporter ATP-binding protein [Kribbella sandramycini]